MFNQYDAQSSDLYSGREILRVTYGIEPIASERTPSVDAELDMARLVLQECRHICQRAGYELLQFTAIDISGGSVPAGCIGVQFALVPSNQVRRVELRECVADFGGSLHPGRIATAVMVAAGTLVDETGTPNS